jgi:DNA (cytosine-5)-methyltransferase 1
MSRKKSYLTFTDQFCGAGGSTIGAKKVGLQGRMALNHWKLAIETHNTNHPEIAHDCTDISACDPRRYPATDLLITSPECTTHSPAGGSRRSKPQRDFFLPAEDPATARSRATMWDVPRFAEFHEYNLVIVENVVEAYRWPNFPTWLQAMHVLGYDHKIVCLNSMFCHPTPQSRDRLYVVFWRRGNPVPKLDFRPPAHCARCEKDVRARQTWKNGRTVGKYRTQYIYTCPTCRSEVQPYYFAALNALDLSIPATRIGDRDRALKPRTLARIRYGLEKYGNRYLLVTTNQTNRLGGRVRTVWRPHFTQPGCGVTGLIQPAFLVNAQHSDGGPLARGITEPLATAAASNRPSLVGLPFLATLRGQSEAHSAVDSLTTVTGGVHHGLVVPPAALIKLRGGEASHLKNAKGLDSAIDTLSSGGNHYLLVSGAAQLSMRDADAMRVAGLDAELRAQGCGPQAALISKAPFIVSHYGTFNASAVDAPVPSVTTIDRHELVSQGENVDVDDCFFRMLQPHEIGAAMAFPDDYVVLGNKRDKVKQFGNAVTPPAMEWLIRQATASLHPEIAA